MLDVLRVRAVWPLHGLNRKAFLDTIFRAPGGPVTTALQRQLDDLRRLVSSEQSIAALFDVAAPEATRLLAPVLADLAVTNPDIVRVDFGMSGMVGNCLGDAAPEGAVYLHHHVDITTGDLVAFVADPIPCPEMKYFAGFDPNADGGDFLFLQTNPVLLLVVPAENLRWIERIAWLKRPWVPAQPIKPNAMAIAIGAKYEPRMTSAQLPADMTKTKALAAVLAKIRDRYRACPEEETPESMMMNFRRLMSG